MDRLTLRYLRPNSGGCRIVDGGRPGWLARGLQQGGAADRSTATCLNQILAQDPENPCLEFTLDGGHWQLSGRGQIALGGADMQWQLNGQPVALYTTIQLDGDYLLTGQAAIRGARTYLAIRGAFLALPQVWTSASPGAPGIQVCTPGDELEVISESPAPLPPNPVPPLPLPDLPLRLPVLPGPEWQLAAIDTRKRATSLVWKVSPHSNRQGLRLLPSGSLIPNKNPETLHSQFKEWKPSGFRLNSERNKFHSTSNQAGLISSPVLPGTIQWTPSGPILLFRDAQTLGGYPRLLIVKEEYLDHIGQLKPGDELFFRL